MTKKVNIRLPLLSPFALFSPHRLPVLIIFFTVQNFSFSPVSDNAIIGNTITWQWVESNSI